MMRWLENARPIQCRQKRKIDLFITVVYNCNRKEISTHESGGDAFVIGLDGTGEITIDGKKYERDASFSRG